jgi:hypothetical protein
MASLLLAGAAEKAVEKSADGIKEVYKVTTGAANTIYDKITGLPETIGNTIEYIENAPSNIAHHIDAVSKSADVLADPEVRENIQNILSKSGEIVSNSIAKHGDELKGAVITGTNDVTNTVGEAALTSLKAVPVLGLAVATGEGTVKTVTSLSNSFINLGNTVKAILDNVIQNGRDLIRTKKGQPFTSVNPSIKGGAKKTRKHMKKVIRDRVLIQSRTNKMIHEFLNPNHTIKRLKTIKTSKTKRRRNK